MKYFLKKPWTKEIICKENYDKWIDKTNYKYSYDEYLKLWSDISEEIISIVCKENQGFDMDNFLGNLSIKRLDREFKCEKDFPTIINYNETTHKKELIPIINIDNKIGRIYWKKVKTRMGLTSLFGMEVKKGFQQKVFKYIKEKGMNSFQLEPNHTTIPSKCEERIETNIFDLA